MAQANLSLSQIRSRITQGAVDYITARVQLITNFAQRRVFVCLLFACVCLLMLRLSFVRRRSTLCAKPLALPAFPHLFDPATRWGKNSWLRFAALGPRKLIYEIDQPISLPSRAEACLCRSMLKRVMKACLRVVSSTLALRTLRGQAQALYEEAW